MTFFQNLKRKIKKYNKSPANQLIFQLRVYNFHFKNENMDK